MTKQIKFAAGTCLLPLLFLLLATRCPAQETPSWEFYGGYALEKAEVRGYYKSSSIVYSVTNQRVTLHGWKASVTENANRWLGGTAEVSGHYNTLNYKGTATRGNIYSVLYGPRFSARFHGVVPFLHVLLGVAHLQSKATPTGPHDSKFSFAATAAGGLDLRLGKTVALRAFQVEYYRTSYFTTDRDRLRASAGILFYLGKRK